MQLTTGIVALASTINAVNALGSAIVKNNCAIPVYLWAVDALRNPANSTLIGSGETYSEVYHVLPSGGVSMKLSTIDDISKPLTQFEYTAEPATVPPFVWYDGSNVNCEGSECPFWKYGVSLAPSDSSCPSRLCIIGEVCTGFYNLFNDDINTLACNPSADVTMVLCPGESGTGSASPSNSIPASISTASVASQTTSVTVPSTTRPAVINEAVVTTFVTRLVTITRRSEPVHHGHMHFHNHAPQ